MKAINFGTRTIIKEGANTVFKRFIAWLERGCRSASEVITVRKFNHRRYVLRRLSTPKLDADAPHVKCLYQWYLDDCVRVGDPYTSVESADWSFGEWIEK